MRLPQIQLVQDDCLAAMARMPSGSVDMILCDLPYGMRAIGIERDFGYFQIAAQRVADRMVERRCAA